MTSLRALPASINGWNAQYLDAQYQAYRDDPASIAPELVPFFQGFDLASARGDGSASPGAGAQGGAGAAESREALRFYAGVTTLVDAYRRLGHLAAHLDPFGRPRGPRPAELSLEAHGLGGGDLQAAVGGVAAVRASPGLPQGTLGQLVEALEALYCGPVGVQYMHIADPARRAWLAEHVERQEQYAPRKGEDRLAIYEALVRAEQFERFLQRRYPGDKRFSLEGGETVVAVLERLLLSASETGVEEIVMGMAHRGRLNILSTILGKTYEQIFTEFQDTTLANVPEAGGDVKYHKGYSARRLLRNGRAIQVAMASNPSHLEAVDPIVIGRTRAKQRLRGDTQERRRVVPLLLHGDAAFIGQGVVPEIFNMSRLAGYTVGGTVHVVHNNQIGFTTLPRDGRSSEYCTDQALAIEAPVFHVNAENPEAAVAVAHLAMLYRQRFGRDVIIDLYCFRKYGHNEQDEASFTQPVMAELIRKMPGVASAYAQRLVADGAFSEAALNEVRARLDAQLEAAQQKAIDNPHDPNIDPGSQRWKGYGSAYAHQAVPTGVKREVLAEVCAAMGRVPDGFAVNPKLQKLLAERSAIPTTGQVSHADAEQIAVGTLLLDGTAVRISGQDVRRGTFSHRHAVVFDARAGETEDGRYVPLNHLRPQAALPDEAGKAGPDGRPTQARYCIYDSPLSEYAVMGFDYGYSLADPNMLVMWEAQFGDFSNGAQIIIDQFISSAEIKWMRWSGLVLLLPHGQEGLGPEHSSCRPERFLQLCGNDNMQVIWPTTGAQIFHALRRQVSPRRPFRKPLIVMTPKSLLRVPTSTFDELTRGSFQEFLDDPAFAAGAARSPAGVKRVLLCSGKIYFDLAERRQATGRWDTALLRAEQLYPFHAEMLKRLLARYPAGASVSWVQEEPRNGGAFQFMNDVLTVLPDPTQSDAGKTLLPRLGYIGKPACASPAVGSKKMHKEEQNALLTSAIGPLPPKAPADSAPAGEPPGAQAAPHAAGKNGSMSQPAPAKAARARK